MKRVKKPKQEKVSLTKKELEKSIRLAGKRATDTACLLMIVSATDELKLTEEQIIAIMVRTERYAHYIEDHLVQIQDVKRIIEEKTGLKFNVGVAQEGM